MKKIGITLGDTNFDNYPIWIKGDDSDIEIIILSYKEKNIEDAQKCDAFVFSGGVDIHPSYYNNSNLNYPNADNFKVDRDEFEKQIFFIAREKKVPILGICRGMQFINVLLGGDLVQDLQAANAVHRKSGGIDKTHLVKLEKDSLISDITKTNEGFVNSSHHQAIGKIAEELKVVAVSEDDIAEAVEYKDKTNKPFMLCVQWHPERLIENENTRVFTKNIRRSFLASIKK